MTVKIFRTEKLIDGSGQLPRKDIDIVVENQKIVDICESDYSLDTDRVYSKPGSVVIPGMIDVHTHLMFGSGSGDYLGVINNDSTGEILIRFFRNAYQHLRSGVTFVRDSGSVAGIGFAIKEAIEHAIYLSPKIHVCGRPITMTGGHFYFCGEESDGNDEVVKSVRKLIKEGADFIKIMASGGGGTPNSDMLRPTFSVDEMIAIVNEAHTQGKTTEAHCLCTESIRRAALAKVDVIDHINFLKPDGKREFDYKVAEQIIKNQLFVCPTIQTGYRKLEELRSRIGYLSETEKHLLDELSYKLEAKLFCVSELHKMGAKIIAGTDATSQFGDYSIGLKLFNDAGLSVLETINASTSLAAAGIGQGSTIGLIKPGYAADFIYLDQDPLVDISNVNQISTVVLNGDIVVEKAVERELSFH